MISVVKNQTTVSESIVPERCALFASAQVFSKSSLPRVSLDTPARRSKKPDGSLRSNRAFTLVNNGAALKIWFVLRVLQSCSWHARDDGLQL